MWAKHLTFDIRQSYLHCFVNNRLNRRSFETRNTNTEIQTTFCQIEARTVGCFLRRPRSFYIKRALLVGEFSSTRADAQLVTRLNKKMSDAVVATPKPAKAKKAAKPKKPASHPKYSDMIKAALTALKEKGGSSRQAILKYIIANNKVDAEAASRHLRMALKAGVKNGTLKQSKGTGASGSFKLGESAVKKPKAKKAAKPKKAAAVKKPKKAVTKKPAGEKKAAKPKAKKAKSPKKAKAAGEKKPKKVAKSPAKAKKAPAKPKAKKAAKPKKAAAKK